MDPTQRNPAYTRWREAETDARFLEWDKKKNDAAHRREIAIQQLHDMGLSTYIISAVQERVSSDLADELAERQLGVHQT